MKIIFKTILFLMLSVLTLGDSLTGRVVYVSDGDTIHLRTEMDKYRIRFYGIDAPESSQEYGLEAKEFAAKKVSGREVRVEVVDTDRYGRLIGKIYYGDTCLNEEVVRHGYAWWYEYFAPNDRKLMEAEAAARNVRAGLWKNPSPVSPW